MFIASMHHYCEKAGSCTTNGQYHEQVWHSMCCYPSMHALPHEEDKRASDSMHA